MSILIHCSSTWTLDKHSKSFNTLALLPLLKRQCIYIKKIFIKQNTSPLLTLYTPKLLIKPFRFSQHFKYSLVENKRGFVFVTF